MMGGMKMRCERSAEVRGEEDNSNAGSTDYCSWEGTLAEYGRHRETWSSDW